MWSPESYIGPKREERKKEGQEKTEKTIYTPSNVKCETAKKRQHLLAPARDFVGWRAVGKCHAFHSAFGWRAATRRRFYGPDSAS
jgi:hypothetical protein